MKIIKKENKNFVTNIVVEVDQKKWKAQQEKAFHSLAKTINIQGFRKGHVPLEVAKSKINEYQIIEKAVNPTIDEVYSELSENLDDEKNSIIVDALSVDINKVDKNNLEITFQFENYPKIELPTIQSLKVDFKNSDVSNEEIEHELNRISKNDWMLSTKDDGQKVINNDMTNIDFTGYCDNLPFPGGDAKNYDLQIGSNSFIPGFEDQIIGMQKNQEKDIFLTFPKDYFEKTLAGKKVKFHVKLNEIKSVIKPKFDEEYIKKFNIPNVKTLNELKDFLKKQIFEMKNTQLKNTVIPQISKKLIETTKIDHFPKTLISDEKKRIMGDIETKANEAKMSLDEYVEKKLGFNQKSLFEKNLQETAEKNLTLVFASEKLITELKINVNENDLNDYFSKIAQYYGTPIEKIKKMFENRIESLRAMIAQQKMFDELIKQFNTK